MDRKKRKKIIIIILLTILIIALLIGLGFMVLVFSLQNSFQDVRFEISVDPGPIRDFIVDSFESLLPTK